MTAVHLGHQRWPDLAVDRPVLALPLGSCEQHGPHLPLDTDTRIAVALAEALADRTAGRVLVAPALAITASGEHQGFPGTLSIGTEATTAVLVEIARSADWASGIVLVNGHGGNAEAVRAAVATLTDEGRHVLPWWPSVADGDAHAGCTETSLLLAIDPTCVDLERAEAGRTEPVRALAGELRRHGVRAVSPTGVLGDPTGATAAHGRQLLDDLTEQLRSAVERWMLERGLPSG